MKHDLLFHVETINASSIGEIGLDAQIPECVRLVITYIQFMSDNKNLKDVDGKFISLTQAWEITYWCGLFGCTEKQLRDAIAKVGNSASAVKKHFGK